MFRLGTIASVFSCFLSVCAAPPPAWADCNPRDFLVQDVTSLQQSGDTELAFVLTSTQSEYENAKKNLGSSGAFGLFSAALSWAQAKERAVHISQATKYDYKSHYAYDYLSQTLSGKAQEMYAQCLERDKEKPGLVLWLQRRDSDYLDLRAFWVGADTTKGVANYDSEPIVRGCTLVSKPTGWIKGKTEKIVLQRDGDKSCFLELRIGGETGSIVVVRDPPAFVWLKEPVISKKVMNVSPRAQNPGCNTGVASDVIYPAHPGGYFIAGTQTTNHTTDDPGNYSETFKETPHQISVTVAQSTGACERTSRAQAQLQALEIYPTAAP